MQPLDEHDCNADMKALEDASSNPAKFYQLIKTMASNVVILNNIPYNMEDE